MARPSCAGLSTKAPAWLSISISAALVESPADPGEPSSRALACNVADSASAADAMGQVEQHFGGLDILVNNAGVGAGFDTSDESWARVIGVNLTALHLLPRGRQADAQGRPQGSIINLSSTVALTGDGPVTAPSKSRGDVPDLLDYPENWRPAAFASTPWYRGRPTRRWPGSLMSTRRRCSKTCRWGECAKPAKC